MGSDFNSDERSLLAGLCAAMVGVGDFLSLPQLICLLTVAAEPGLSVNDLAARISVPQQSASRYVAALLGRYQSVVDRGPIEPLIRQEVSSDDPRKRALYINEAGYDLLARMLESSSSNKSMRRT